jgi:hypothetical protein
MPHRGALGHVGDALGHLEGQAVNEVVGLDHVVRQLPVRYANLVNKTR